MRRVGHVIAMVVLLSGAVILSPAAAAAQAPAPQRAFESPEAAVTALVTALKAGDDKALVEIFGARHADLVGSADPAQRQTRARFVAAAEEYRLLRPTARGRTRLVVGFQAWPFPIPLVKDGAGWRFDTDAGREEVLIRRVGANELATIETVRAYVDAQRQYAARPRDGTNVREFARKIRSTPGKKDGLHWEADAAKGEEPSPLGPLVAAAGIRASDSSYNGYRFKILTRQGPAAPAARYDYVINGRMVAGFALVAYPAEYGTSGIKTFLVNHYGVVYEKDLGPGTAKIASAMTEYNPDRSWSAVEE